MNEGRYRGEAFTRVCRYTSTYVWKEGRWRLLATHFSRVPAQ